ncbi:MAG: 4Fe-4S dicluster domain-containing protein [Gemmatimonadota bacterium]
MSPLPTGDDNRRGFLRSVFGDLAQRLVERVEEKVVVRRYTRPPGALPEAGFLAACTRCGACVTACPVHAIFTAPASAGLAAATPFLDLKLQPCIACPDMPCARACPTEALSVPPDGWKGYRLGVLELDAERCITFHGQPCGVCAEKCPIGPSALAMDEGGHPVIRQEGCVGCGVCVQGCVTVPSSFKLTPVEHR